MVIDASIILGLIIVILLWLGVISLVVYRGRERFRRLSSGVDRGNLEAVVEKVISENRQATSLINNLETRLSIIEGYQQTEVQKVGIYKYNPFADTGGNQSFILALLDGRDSGVVLTSLHTRGVTRWFAKNVKNGHGEDFELSEEEKKAIKNIKSLRARP